MKFQKLEPFEQNVKSSFLQHLSPIYLVICPKESERKKILSSLITLLEPRADLKKASFVGEAIQHLNSASLFSEKMGAIFDGVELLTKTEVEALFSYIATPNPNGILLLGAASSKNTAELYKKGKKEMVVLDLTAEKPWEESQRLQSWVVRMLQSRKKQASPEALRLLFEWLPLDRFLLEQELEKLCCYLGERPLLEKGDVEALCVLSTTKKPYKIAQELVWEGRKQPLFETAEVLPFIASVRIQLEMGLKMGALLRKGASQEEIKSAFPKLWPKVLEQVVQGTRRKGLSFFKKGLLALFDLELGVKSSVTKPSVLYTRFCSHF